MTLKQWRKSHGLSLIALSEQTGISKSQLHRLENGLNSQISVEAALKLEQHTKGQVTVRDLMPKAAA